MNKEQLEELMEKLQLAAQLAVMTKRAAEAELQLVMVQMSQVKGQLADLEKEPVNDKLK